MSHEVGEGSSEVGIKIILTFIYPSKLGCWEADSASPPRLLLGSPAGMSPLLCSLWDGWIRARLGCPRAEQSLGAADGAEQCCPCKLVRLSGRSSTPREHSCFLCSTLRCRGLFIPPCLPFKCRESLKLMLLYFDENNVFIIRLLFTWKM